MNLRKKYTKGAKFELHPRDIEIVRLLSLGYKPIQISEGSGITARTVETIIENIRFEYDCINAAHLVATFLRNGLIK